MSHNYAEKISLSSVASADAADADRQSEAGMGYQQTLMYGRYSKEMLKLQYYLIRPRR